MNKTLSIGLAGFSFIIEEHAYIKLSDYLQALRNSLDAAEADEVMHDIEIRMVEILRETLQKREVVNDSDVEKIIAQIGTPEQIDEQEEAYFSEKPRTKQGRVYTAPVTKQLFRDPENQKIAGVCAGLASYFGMDVTWMRVIWFAIAFLGIFTAAISTSLIVLLYIVLWIVLPKAQTASDFLKMKGLPVNFDNIKEESSKIVQFTNEAGERVNQVFRESRPYISNAGSGIWNVFRYVLGAIFAFIALSLIIASFGIFGFYDSSNVNFFDNVGFYMQENNLGYILIALAFLTVLIPAIIFAFLAIKLLSPKTKLNYTGYVIGSLAFLWIALAAFSGATAIKMKSQYSGHNEESQDVAINTSSDTLYVDVKKVGIPANFKSYWDDVYSDQKTVYKEDYPSVKVTKKANVTQPYLVISKRADGYNLPLQMNVPVEIANNKILLPNYFSFPYANRLRDYRVDYELVIPPTKKVLSVKDYGISLHGDTDEDGNSDQNQNQSININSDESDSITVNGKKIHQDDADNLLKKMNLDMDSLEDINIQIKNGKKEISIKTK